MPQQGPSAEETIVVVSGLPRSGTSMAMRMLAAGGMAILTDGARIADEDNPNGYFEDERVKGLRKAPDNAWVGEARGKALKVVSPLLKHLPPTYRYQVLFVRRALKEVLASQAKMLARRNQPSKASDEEMERLFERDLEKVIQFLASSPQFEVLELGHEAVIAEPLREARRIRDFLGRPLDVEKMAAAVDSRLHRNRG
jgi:sulfotransferase family protein